MNLRDELVEKKELRLTEEQLKIINHVYGNALTLATAGSGKTTTICGRVGNLIKYHNIDPEKILILSYSKASVIDIKDRFKKLFTHIIHLNETNKINFSTMHSFSYSNIKRLEKYNKKQYKVLTEEEKRKLIADLFKNINYRDPKGGELNQIMNMISFINNNKIHNIVDINSFTLIEGFGEIYKQYEDVKGDLHKLDFEDMLFNFYTKLRDYKYIRENISEKYDYIIVDEGQDISQLQYEIIKLLSNNNTMIIADDDQSIYSFRGSNPKILFEFKNELKPTLFYLSTNYRSEKCIVELSKKFIMSNPHRFKKQIQTKSSNDGNIIIKGFNNNEDESKYIAKTIKDNFMEDLEETAILVKDNIVSIKIFYYLINYQIPFKNNINKVKFFYHFTKNDILMTLMLARIDRTEARALLEFYNKINLPFNHSDMLRIYKDKYKNEDLFTSFERILELSYKQKKALDKFNKDLDHISNIDPSEAINYFINDMGYIDYLNELSKKSKSTYLVYKRYIDLLYFFAEGEKTILGFLDKIARFYSKIKDSSDNLNRSGVSILTVHGSKGLEFDNVFIPSVNYGMFPSQDLQDDLGDYELELYYEERRLMYVGLTRARKNLYILNSGEKSDFIKELTDINKNL